MKETIPTDFEKTPPTREEVVQALTEDPNNQEPLHAYVAERESKVRTSREGLMLVVEVADIYLATQLYGAATATLEDAIEAAWQEGDDALVEELREKLNTIPLS